MGSTAEGKPAIEAISEVAEMSDEAMALVKPQIHPLDYVSLLMDKKLYPDAVRFLAHGLPKREAVWWGWVSAKRTAGENPPQKIRAALAATERWIADPNDVNRRAAMDAAETAEFDTAAGCAGLGAFFSGGSIAPANAPEVPPGEYLTAKAISGAVLLAALKVEPEKAPEKFKSFVAQGVDVANRIQLWPK
jgi:hypothetical protein